MKLKQRLRFAKAFVLALTSCFAADDKGPFSWDWARYVLIRNAGRTVLEQPLTAMQIAIQAAAVGQSSTSVLKERLHKDGWLFLAKGNVARWQLAGIRTLYTWPIVLYTPLYIPDANSTTQKIATAGFWALINCPFETYFQQKSQDRILNKEKPIFSSSYAFLKYYLRGAPPTFQSGFFSYSTFMVADDALKKVARKGQSPVIPLTWEQQFSVTSALTAGNMLINHPFSMIRTRMQDQQNLSFRSAIRMLYQEGGVRNLYRAWPLCTFRTFLFTLMDSALIDYTDRQRLSTMK